jgi:hypothetical protein
VIVCGVEIRAKEALLALIRSGADGAEHIPCATKRLSLQDDRDTKSLLTLKSSIEAFALQNNVSVFVIKSRQARGPRAGGGVTFKIETLFQLAGTDVIFINPVALSKFAKSNLGGVPASVLAYQTDAYRVGACHLSKL